MLNLRTRHAHTSAFRLATPALHCALGHSWREYELRTLPINVRLA